MGADIDYAAVSGVLLHDGWHFIQPGTFRIEQYRFVSEDGSLPDTVPTAGFTFTKVDQITRDVQIYNGPLASLLAVRHEVPLTLHDDEDEEE